MQEEIDKVAWGIPRYNPEWSSKRSGLFYLLLPYEIARLKT